MRNPLAGLAGVFNELRARTRGYMQRYAFFGRGVAGVHVTHDSAMQVSAVWACIDVISSALAASDWNVYEGSRGDDTKKAVRSDDMLQYVLNSRFNKEMTAQSGKRALSIAAVGFGNGVAEIERDLAGRIVGLWPLEPTRAEIRRYTDTSELFYRIFQSSGGFVDLAPADVFHIRGAGLSGFAGDDPIGRAIQSISSAVALDQFAAAYFNNGAQPGTLIKVPGLKRMPDPEYNRLKEQWSDRHQGPKNSFRVGFLDSSMTVENQGALDASKTEMVEWKYLSVEEICRWFRVPPHKIAHLLRATNNNIEHQGLEFSRDTLRPWKMEIEQECDWSLIPLRGPKKFIELDVDWTEQGDYGSRMTAYGTGIEKGVFCVNDVLRKLGENTIGAEGNIRMVNGSYMPLKDVGKNLVPNQRQQPRRTEDAASDDAANAAIEAAVRVTFQRLQKRQNNRRTDLERSGRPDAAVRARIDALNHVTTAVDEVHDVLLARWDTFRADAEREGRNVVRSHKTAADAARDLILTLRRSESRK